MGIWVYMDVTLILHNIQRGPWLTKLELVCVKEKVADFSELHILAKFFQVVLVICDSTLGIHIIGAWLLKLQGINHKKKGM